MSDCGNLGLKNSLTLLVYDFFFSCQAVKGHTGLLFKM